MLANILGYVPVGIVLWDLGPFRAVMTATVVAISAETAQLVMAIEIPRSTIYCQTSQVRPGDRRYCKFHRPALAVGQVKSQIAAVPALVIVVAVWLTSDDGMVSTRGVISPGRLEAYWKLDESSGRIAEDSSGHGISGGFSKEPNRIDSETGRAVLLDGSKDDVDFGFSTALRLAGSTTITAWVKSTSYPIDDAAIVSSALSPDGSAFAGYQLDTTTDSGPRTIGFKIANECRRLAARYGATPLLAGTWYHVAGVYDSEARTLDVYLNGELDNGFLLGSVTSAQHSSRSHVYIGRRSDWAVSRAKYGTGFEFAGFIHDVRIYSRALTAAQITSEMGALSATSWHPSMSQERMPTANEHYHFRSWSTRRAQSPLIPTTSTFQSLPGVGLLVAVPCIGLWPYGDGLLWLLGSLAARLLLPTSTLPPINLWLVPPNQSCRGCVRCRLDPSSRGGSMKYGVADIPATVRAFFLKGQPAKHIPEALPQFSRHLPTYVLGNEHHVVFAEAMSQAN